MKNNIFNLILLYSILSISNAEAGGLQDHSSEMDSAGLWYLNENGSTLSYEETDNSFFTYCDGKNKVYVSGLPLQANGFVCTSNKDQFGHSLYLAGFRGKEGVYAITKSKLADKSWVITVPSKFELSVIKQKALSRISNEPYKVDGDLKYKREIIYGALLKYAKKITVGKLSLFVIPTLATETESDEPIITSTIIVNNNNTYQYVGQIEGIPSVGSDLDKDGIPEIFSEEFYYEGTVHKYYKISPEVRILMTNSSS